MSFIHQLDFIAASFAKSARSDFLILFFKTLTYFGEWRMVFIVTAIISAFLISKRKKIYTFTLWLTILGTTASTFLLKEIIHRPRPFDGTVNESSFSFPSAHSALSVALYVFIIYLLWQKSKSRTEKIIITSVGALFILLIGFSRLYLSAHYLSDVLGGYVLGALWLALGICVFKRITCNKKYKSAENKFCK